MRRFIPKWMIATAYLQHGCLAFILLGLVQSLTLYLHCAPFRCIIHRFFIVSYSMLEFSIYTATFSYNLLCSFFLTRWLINLLYLFTCSRILFISVLCSNKVWWWLEHLLTLHCTFGAGIHIIQSRAALQVTRRMQAQRQVFQFNAPWRRRRCCWSGSGVSESKPKDEDEVKTMPLPAHARIIMSLWCRLSYNSTRCRINKAHPAPFVLSFALSVTPSFWHHLPFPPLPPWPLLLPVCRLGHARRLSVCAFNLFDASRR